MAATTTAPTRTATTTTAAIDTQDAALLRLRAIALPDGGGAGLLTLRHVCGFFDDHGRNHAGLGLPPRTRRLAAALLRLGALPVPVPISIAVPVGVGIRAPGRHHA